MDKLVLPEIMLHVLNLTFRNHTAVHTNRANVAILVSLPTERFQASILKIRNLKNSYMGFIVSSRRIQQNTNRR